MANSPVKAEAFADLDLLNTVIRFKDKFNRCSYAKYDEAKPGTMKLIPSEKNIKILREDYEHMKNMIYGEKPDFDVVLKAVKHLKNEINAL